MRQCKECGARFVPRRSTQTYCGRRCQVVSFNRKMKEQRRSVFDRAGVCARPGCEGEFRKKAPQHRFCSHACARKHASDSRVRGMLAPEPVMQVGDAVLAYTDRRSTLLDKLGENGPLRLQWEMLERAVRDVREDGPLRDDAAEWLRGERDADLLPFCSATSCLATFRLDQAAVCEALGI